MRFYPFIKKLFNIKHKIHPVIFHWLHSKNNICTTESELQSKIKDFIKNEKNKNKSLNILNQDRQIIKVKFDHSNQKWISYWV